MNSKTYHPLVQLTLSFVLLGIPCQLSAQDQAAATPATKTIIEPQIKAANAQPIKHRVLSCGKQTYILEEDGTQSWTYPSSTRDGYVLENGKILLTLSKSKKHKGGAVILIDPANNEETLVWKGTQAEVNGAQPTPTGTFVLTEAGEKPRLLEINQAGDIQVEFALKCQKKRKHMQTRMARKLSDATYLVPHLLDFAVFHYDGQGNVLAKFDTTVKGDNKHEIHSWPFTAIRKDDGNTVVCMTHSNRVAEFDPEGKIVWQLSNDDLPEKLLHDPCGAQVLPNGNLVIASYAAPRHDKNSPKMFEVNRDKQVVWKYVAPNVSGVHHFQILTTDGQRVSQPNK